MPTDNRRVATYLPKEIDSAFKAFKDERGIGDSAALILILSERLGVTHSVNQVDYSRFATVGQLEELATKVSELATTVERSNLPNTLLSNLPNKIKRLEERIDSFESLTRQPVIDQIAVTESKPSSKLFINSCPTKESESELHSNSPVEDLNSYEKEGIRFSAVHLAKRLGIGGSTISVRKNDSPEKFAEWSRSKDPDNIPWSFSVESNRFQPIGSLSRELESELLSELPNEFHNTLTTGELAKRIGMDNSTLSHWKSTDPKRGKSPEELLQATRAKDPDGIGWILLPESKRFKPERDLPNGSPSESQGELLSFNAVDSDQVNPVSPLGSERSEEG